MAKSKIIKDLARGEVGVEIALKELKILLKDFPDKKLIDWVNKELTGYTNEDELPSYRVKEASLKGTFLSYTNSFSNVGIPIRDDAPEVVKSKLTEVGFKDSIYSLRGLEEKSVAFPIPPDLYLGIMRYSMINITALLDAKLNVSSTAVSEIISTVENKILDAMLVLEDRFGCLDALDIDLNNSTQSNIENIEERLLVIIYNDRSINIGDRNKITGSSITNTVVSKEENE